MVGSKMKILVVDDTRSILEVIKELLEGEGHNVITAGNGKEALEICKDENILLVVSDIKMPEMDGIEFCQELRKFNPITYALALTSYRKLFHVAECRSAGFDDYMMKPFDHKGTNQRVNMGIHKITEWIDINNKM